VERILTVDDLERLAIGAGILGTGGGGNPYLGKIRALQHLKEGAEIRVIDIDDVPDDALVTSVGGMGAPTVGVERLSRGDETLVAMRALEAHIGKSFTHLIAGEIGGSNAIAPLIVAAQTGLPVIDGDGMGRAFPELQMDTFMISGISPTPAALADHSHHNVVFDHIDNPSTLERYARVVTIQMGGGAGLAVPVMTGAQVKAAAIPGTMSLAIAIGDAVIATRSGKGDPVDAALSVSGGERLFAGKIVSVERRNEAGFAKGVLKLEGTGNDSGRSVSIDFQNENLIVRAENGEALAIVPDLICLVDEDSAEPITTEIVRYGLRVVVIGIPAPEQLKTDAALAVVGPAAFGYPGIEYVPMAGIYGQGITTASVR
jgi:hypothetical protein